MHIKTRSEVIESSITNSNENVYLTVTIGNAQIGGSVIRWKNSNDIIGKGEILNLNLGKSIDIQDKTLEITTNTLDVNQLTNGIVNTYYFHNTTIQSYTVTDIVDNHGDVFSLKIKVNFI